MLHLAYIDPGTGSFVVQAVIGTVLGVSFTIRRQVSALFRKLTGKNKPVATDTAVKSDAGAPKAPVKSDKADGKVDE